MEFDVAVIGCGPAGIQAAIHAVRKKVSVVIIGKTQNSAMMGTHIENYFGMPGEVNGELMLKNGMSQIKIFGCTVLEKNIIAASNVGNMFSLTTEDDEEITVKSVVIATGISRKGLNVPGEKALFGKGTAVAQDVKSPNGNVCLSFALRNGCPTYQLTYKGRDVVKPSRLGLELAKDKHASRGNDETDLMEGFTVADTQTSTFDETWKPVWGETATIRNHYTLFISLPSLLCPMLNSFIIVINGKLGESKF